MSSRSRSQKIGARGHKWFSSHVEEYPDWLSRDLGEDYGIDLELELHEGGFRGDLVKVQIKSTSEAARKDGQVKVEIERKYLEYASSSRYPVILVLVCLETKCTWYVWLQEWLLIRRMENDPLSQSQNSWTEWVSDSHTVQAGLDLELKSIARWEGQTQLVLTLQDAMRCAAAAAKRDVLRAVGEIVSSSVPYAGEAGQNALIGQAINLGNRMWAIPEGNLVARQLYELIRHSGGRVTKRIVINLVLRGDSYSRVGINALSILYDERFGHAKSLKLPETFCKLEPRVAYYCAMRKALPGETFVDVPPDGFRYGGLKYVAPDYPLNKYANRGASEILDYLFPEDWESSNDV